VQDDATGHEELFAVGLDLELFRGVRQGPHPEKKNEVGEINDAILVYLPVRY
jgi:hypothetical protein